MPGLLMSAYISFDKTNVCSTECTRLALLELQDCLTFLSLSLLRSSLHDSEILAGEVQLQF